MRAVDDLELGGVADGARLRRREVGVEDQHVGVELHRARDQISSSLPLPDEVASDRPRGRRCVDDVEHAHAGGAAQLASSAQARVRARRRVLRPIVHVHQHRAVLAVVDDARGAARARRTRPRARGSARAKSGARWRSSSCAEIGSSTRHCSPAAFGGKQVRARERPGLPVRASSAIAATEIEPQQREVDEIVARQRLAAQVGVDEPQAAEAAGAGAARPEVGQVRACDASPTMTCSISPLRSTRTPTWRSIVARALAQKRRQLGRHDLRRARRAGGRCARASSSAPVTGPGYFRKVAPHHTCKGGKPTRSWARVHVV